MIRKLTIVLLLLLTVVALAGVPQASANSTIKNNFTTLYGVVGTRIDSCSTCHTTSPPTLNPYGKDLFNDSAYGTNVSQSMRNIEPKDSDTDTFINIDEIHNLTFPGNPNDFPPKIIGFAPPSPVTSTGTQKFNVTINQVVDNATWRLDGNVTKTDNNVNASDVTLTTILMGTHTVTFTAQRTGDGSAMQNWTWRVKLGSISGTKFNDSDGDGVKDANEEGLANWTITLKTSAGTILNPTQTDSNGDYRFINLPPDNYTVGEDIKPNWTQTKPVPPGTYSVTITSAGEDVFAKDFGNMLKPPQVNLGSISGTKFNDLNGNGTRDAGEPVLANWVIELLNSTGVPINNTRTDTNGSYKFSNLAPGSYIVDESQQTGWKQTAPKEGSYRVNITSAGENVTGKDFGNMQVKLGSISGMKFNDSNGNAFKDTNETGLANWTIVLKNSSTFSQIANTTTDKNGNYTFTNLSAGNYTVTEMLQPGWRITKGLDGYTVSITSAGENFTGKDFGNLKKPVRILGMKFNDSDGDGKKDANEAGLANWTIVLTKLPEKTNETTLTDASGNYSFTNLVNSEYLVSEVQQAGWIQTAPLNQQYAQNGIWHFGVSGFGDVTDIDFGNMKQVRLGSISGMKFNDSDGDGVKDANESGLANWTITLSCPACGTVLANTTTDANGTYKFSNLSAGNYTVGEVLQTGWTQTAPPTGTYPVTITSAGENVTGKDFGNMRQVVKLGSISGMKFNDSDGDGVKDANESGLANWTITLTGAATATATTDANGTYKFSNLSAGNYTVGEVLQTGWTQTAPPAGTYPVTITSAGENVTGKDFGNMRQVVKLGSISGMKFNDSDGDGVKDANEAGLANWTITLKNSSTGAPIFNTTTASDGSYKFSNLAAGNYTVGEVLKSGWKQTAPTPVPPGTYTVTLAAGQDVTGKDFGNMLLVPPPPSVNGSISGNVINVAIGKGLPSVNIRLVGIVGTGVDTKQIRTETMTDSAGRWVFNNLQAGRYIIIEQLPKGLIPVSPPVMNIMLAKGQNSMDNNFTNQPPIPRPGPTIPLPSPTPTSTTPAPTSTI